MSELEIERLRFQERGPVDLVAREGECVVLTGPSGVGKSLFLRAVADLDPHEGRVLLDHVSSDELPAPEWRRRVGMLPAESGWWLDDVGGHFPDGDDAGRLEALGLTRQALRWQVQRLSTGERQRLAIARLLANAPSALLLDEPTASLDPENVERAERLFRSYRRDAGAPVVWVSHDPEQARRVGDRRVVMRADGRIEELAW